MNLLIKPSSSQCNMRCGYCFYCDEAQHRAIPSYGFMDSGTLEKIIAKAFAHAGQHCSIAFQGGEPTLMGIDFYKQLMEIEKKYWKKGLQVQNLIQTNGYGLDEQWASFFAEHDFLVGISLDGMKHVHDKYRKTAKGNSTFETVMDTLKLFQKKNVQFNVLTVVTAHSAPRIEKIYSYFQKQGFRYQQYIPCIESLDTRDTDEVYGLTETQYSQFLITLFDCWFADMCRGNYISIRYFDNLMAIIMGGQPESCNMSGSCGKQYVIESDGSVFPCDFYAYDGWQLGNFVTDTIEAIEAKRNSLRFIQDSRVVHSDCKKCKWLSLCRGGCKRDKTMSPEGILSKNRYCGVYAAFLEYAVPRLRYLIKTIHQQQTVNKRVGL